MIILLAIHFYIFNFAALMGSVSLPSVVIHLHKNHAVNVESKCFMFFYLKKWKFKKNKKIERSKFPTHVCVGWLLRV